MQIDQVLTNLLENAARHTPVGTPIRVRAWHEDDWVTVAVSDGGPGVDEAMAAHLFEPFGSRTSTGIGLTICRAIVEAHGGTLTLRDAAEGGVEVRFALRPC